MIVWLNGAFGVGKTATAAHLLPLLPEARSVDPERLGWVLQRTLGRLARGDFQHLWSWRRGTALLTHRAARHGGPVVVPMSVLRPDYLDELLARLRAQGHRVHHVLMDAPPDVLHERIANDTGHPAAARWRRDHVGVYEDVRAELAERGITVETGLRTPGECAAVIAAAVTGGYAPGAGR